MTSQPTYKLALVIPYDAPFAEQIAIGVADAAVTFSQNMTVVRYETEADIDQTRLAGFDGILILPPRSNWQPPIETNTKYQLLLTDSRAIGFERELLKADILELGSNLEKRAIAFVGDRSIWSQSEPISSLMDSNLFRETYILEGTERALDRLNFQIGPVRRLADFLTSFRERVLIVCANSRCASVVMHTSNSLQLAIPKSIAIACIADDFQARLNSVTAFEVPFGRIGKSGFEALMATLNNQPSNRRVSFRLKLRQRETTLGLHLARSSVMRAVEMIESLACKGLRVVDVVNSIGTSQKTLNRQFKRHFGTTLGHKIRDVRVDRAKTLLVETDLPITSIAAECGFQDPAKFCGFFKRETGQTPTEHRLAAQPKAGEVGNQPIENEATRDQAAQSESTRIDTIADQSSNLPPTGIDEPRRNNDALNTEAPNTDALRRPNGNNEIND